ncbi:hypothetical protein WJT86_03345 [Microvirga sp. W0021]|uniref:Uncharacterized protein n=1 Tax=Hohaiivirga grylli TaxID=3133970 RepID=A0ABV0BKN3_9HYPH
MLRLVLAVVLALVTQMHFASAKTEKVDDGPRMPPEIVQKVLKEVSDNIRKCWKVPASLRKINKTDRAIVHIRFALAMDGSISSGPVLLKTQGNQMYSKILGESAITAVKNCSPFSFLVKYKEYYGQWKEIKLRFDSRQ